MCAHTHTQLYRLSILLLGFGLTFLLGNIKDLTEIAFAALELVSLLCAAPKNIVTALL